MADGRQGSIWDALGGPPPEATKPKDPSYPLVPQEQIDPLAHWFPPKRQTLLTHDMGAVADAHPRDRLETVVSQAVV